MQLERQDLCNARVIAILVLALSTAGCSDASVMDPASQAQQNDEGNRTAETSPATGELKLTVYADMNSSDMQTFPNPDAELIEKQTRALNWVDSKRRPYVHLSRVDTSGGSFLKLQGTQGTPNEDGLFRAVGYRIDGLNWAGESPPLESVDAGLELLLLFRNDPEQLKTMVGDWKIHSGE